MMSVGLLGSFLLALCGLPLLVDSLKNKNALQGLSGPFLLMWCLGEWFTFGYYLYTLGIDIPTILNYGINTTITTYLLWRKYGD